MSSQTIKIDDINLSYESFGQGDVVLMLHGWGQSGACFKYVAEQLSSKYCVYTLDLPGFGDSDEPSSAYDIYDYEYIVAKFIQELKLKDITLVGHSFGGRISIIYSAQTDNVHRLILTGAAGIKPKRSLRYYLSVYHYKFMKFLTKTPLYCQYHDALVAGSGSSDYKNASPILKQVLSKVVNQDLTHLLTEIKAKTLLFWGEYDDATPLSDGYIMDELIPNSKLVISAGNTHYAFLEDADTFYQEILQVMEDDE